MLYNRIKVVFVMIFSLWSILASILCYGGSDEIKEILAYGNAKATYSYNKAVDLARRYTAEQSSGDLVNGMLNFLELSLKTYDPKAIHNLANLYQDRKMINHAKLVFRESAELGLQLSISSLSQFFL
ncbi:MAG: hypothetical protein ACRY3E_03905, partial [Candidatus Lariskella arthropodorum]